MRNLFFSGLIFIFGFISYSQDERTQELDTNVPELIEYHETIYKIWHDAWPKKDIQLLKDLVPEIIDGYKKLHNVKLTGILRDKQSSWEKNISYLGESIEQYKMAIDNDDTTAILKAAEDIHSYYEKLVRTIRPVIKELDDFHKTLYLLYHYYISEYDYQNIKLSTDTLLMKMGNLKKAELPKRLKSKEKEFTVALKDLDNSLRNLNKILKTEKKEEILEAVEVMHSKYQRLESIFD